MMVTNAARLAVPEQILMLRDEEAALEGMIVIHSSALGPAAGGCRLWTYASADAAMDDACRLAQGMAFKNAVAGLPLGGGKAVLRRPAGDFDRARLFRAFGRAVADLRGGYVTAEDVGTTVGDMLHVLESTRFVAGLPPRLGRPGGDPSPWTARGVFVAMKRAVELRLERPLADCKVAVQGVGHVGHALACMLHAEGATLVVADVDPTNLDRVVAATGATPVETDVIAASAADVFAPCALGAVLSHATVGRLQAKVVCGAANNQLAEPEDGARLADHGVLYAPDYVVNAGGIINVAAEYLGWASEEVVRRVDATGDRMMHVLDLACSEGLSTNLAADRLAGSMIASSRADLTRAA